MPNYTQIVKQRKTDEAWQRCLLTALAIVLPPLAALAGAYTLACLLHCLGMF